MKRVTITIWLLVVCATFRGYATDAPVATIGTVSSYDITATVPITAAGFTNVGSYSLRVTYDPSIVTVASVTQGPLLSGSIDVNTSISGQITLSWYSDEGLTLSGTPVVANIVFNKVKSGVSTLAFSDNGVSCSWYDGYGTQYNDSPFASFYFPGSITFLSLPAPGTWAPAVSACPGTVVQVPIRVTNFTNIGSLSLTLNFNTSVLTYVSATNNSGFPGFSASGSVPGKVRIAGYSSGSGRTYSDNTILCTLSFLCTSSGGTSSLTWYDTGITCEYTDYPGYTTLTDTPTANFYHDGSVTVYNPLSAGISGGTTPVCYNTSPGTFTASGSGGTGSYTYQWYTTTGIISGATDATYAPGNITETTGYYCEVTSTPCGSANSSTTTITVIPLPDPPTAGNVNVTYDGNAHTGSATPPSGTTLYWYDAATGNTPSAAPSGTHVGSYSSWAEVVDNTTGCISYPRIQVTVTITKADPTIVVNGYTGTYDGNAHGATGTATGVLGETLAGLDLGASFTNVPGGTAYWTFTDVTGNYNDKNGSVEIVLGKANATITVTPYSVTYDGYAHTATGTATGVETIPAD
ncbi:MAG TPA: cohesin domain-containing protein, partial [Bacteroidales bacterium]|nr:cohesin domain-containing protein [Bacteroidales bacterium]